MKPCAIGKLVVRTPVAFEWRVPHLHIVVYKQEEGFFCTNIEISLTAFGTSVDQAVKNTASVTLQYLNQNVRTPEGYNALIQLVDDSVMDEIWRDYRVAEFQLGRSKQDTGNGLKETYERIIQQLHAQHISELFKQYEADPDGSLERLQEPGEFDFDIEELEFQEIPLNTAA